MMLSQQTTAGRMTIFIERLEIAARIGVHAHEQGRTQPLFISVEMDIPAPQADHISETVDYEAVADVCARVIATGHIQTVEHVAREIGRRLLDELHILHLRVKVEKPGAIAAARVAGATWSEGRTVPLEA